MVKVGDKLSKEILLQCGIDSLENSKNYLKDAKKILNSSCGHSYALRVLGLEELHKASIFYTIPFFERSLPLEIDESLASLFKGRYSHVMKQLGQSSSAEISAIAAFYRKKLKIKKIDSFEMLKDLIKNISDERFEELRKELEDIDEVFGDHNDRKMQVFKEKGMYVDIKNGKVTGPKDISKELTKRVISYLEKEIKKTDSIFRKIKTIKTDEFLKNFSISP